MRNKRWGPWIGVVVIYVAAACFAAPLGFVVVFGLAALGFETGWWPGDSNMNDGEGVPVTMGGLTLLAGLTLIAGRGAWGCLERAGARGAQRWLPLAASSTLFAITVAVAFAAVLAWY